MKEAFILVGPLAAGKSYIGKLMESEFCIPFLAYENVFVDEYRKGGNDYLSRVEPLADKVIFDFLDNKKKICFENTMNRKYALDILDKANF